MKPEDLAEYPALNDVEANFQLYSRVATEDNSSVEPALVSKLNGIASKVKSALAHIKTNPLIDHGEAMKLIADATKAEIGAVVSKVTGPLTKDLESETKNLWTIRETPRAREIRDNYAGLLADPIKLSADTMSDEVFEALANAPAAPVTFEKGTERERVEFRKFFSHEVAEKELLKRRPDTASRLSAFNNRRDSAFGMGKVLMREVESATNTGSGWEPPIPV